ncbi:MAG: C4-dicarboxylate ABC transporter [Deltaproteobacteria bacterium RIFCSPLOWO2_12_FULL_40_28]|nr:MAG: C4-dicarboxylate ABC transporter [Deltaproteobacteria bacterium RIFCSPHIGHO2_02_FULL_40_28]OGQ19269.1 MAG: C4-dicarboxylate ABC transporter [Deltaproteobacteria bacterium RIFCSPHIGHO2_12_FULL_40_32]OGQ40507.1 MAG: C4-dicarboxylate ABC transporter [Deltaproteobacteria bacterium RIFCSPLOWO2_02_FULL_40_36]OGQ53743.1 MAG: C4-dicarboxylate ABC transporter [Deltaproteobacteria bacterium RIFCSPLOWO2_12_FULL_40_28]
MGITIALSTLALLGTPLFVLFGASALTLFMQAHINISAVMIEFYRLASAPTLSAIPFFTFAGFILAESNAPKRLVNVAKAFVGFLPGGLPIVTVLVCAFFTAFTGASGVTIIALGGLLYPALMKEKYKERFSIGVVTSCGSIGLLLPPSLPLILYGLIAQVSIDKLFIAGILPSLLLVGLFSIYSCFIGVRSKIERIPFKPKNIWKSLKDAKWEMPLPIIVLYGIYGGIITASEAAAITAIYAFIVEVFIIKDLKLKRDVPKIMVESITMVGGILIILGVAMGLTNYLVDQDVTTQIFNWVKPHITSQAMFLLLLNVFLLIVGSLMDIFSAIIVVVPIIMPLALKYGVNPIHLGMIFLTNLEVGYLHPPLGLNLFIASYRFKKSLYELYWATLPFLILVIIALLVITYVPELSLYLIKMLNVR